MNIKSFSHFPPGHRKDDGKVVPPTRPMGTTNCPAVYNIIKSDVFKPLTLALRSMIENVKDEALAEFKLLNFQSVTSAGTFQRRCASGIITPSDLLTIDIDGLKSEAAAREMMHRLIDDPLIEVDLAFLSPKGLGVKAFVTIPDWLREKSFKQSFDFFTKHIAATHGVLIDQSGSDISRLAFLCWDEHAYLNPKYFINNTNS